MYEYNQNDEKGAYRWATFGGKHIKIYKELGIVKSMIQSKKFKKQNEKSETNYNFSEKLIEEIQNKTYKNFEGINDVEMYNVKKLLGFKSTGGYRTEKEIEELKNSIVKNGIQQPIELIKENDKIVKIEQGNHRLDIAKKIGLKEIPVKYINKS